MNQDDLLAYGQLAQAMAMHIFSQAEHDDAKIREGRPELRDEPWPIYYHYSTSTFERATDYLARLGILKGVGPHAKTIPFYFVFESKVEDAAELAKRNWSSGPTLQELIVAFVDLFGEYGAAYWGFSTKRDTPFGEGGRIAPALDALCSLGYLRRTDKGFVWTKLSIDTMRSAGYWQETDPAQ